LAVHAAPLPEPALRSATSQKTGRFEQRAYTDFQAKGNRGAKGRVIGTSDPVVAPASGKDHIQSARGQIVQVDVRLAVHAVGDCS
jgi:hypothetical protein